MPVLMIPVAASVMLLVLLLLSTLVEHVQLELRGAARAQALAGELGRTRAAAVAEGADPLLRETLTQDVFQAPRPPGAARQRCAPTRRGEAPAAGAAPSPAGRR